MDAREAKSAYRQQRSKNLRYKGRGRGKVTGASEEGIGVPAEPEASSSSSRPSLPSNWDRYEDSDEEDGQNNLTAEEKAALAIAPRSQGADYASLLHDGYEGVYGGLNRFHSQALGAESWELHDPLLQSAAAFHLGSILSLDLAALNESLAALPLQHMLELGNDYLPIDQDYVSDNSSESDDNEEDEEMEGEASETAAAKGAEEAIQKLSTHGPGKKNLPSSDDEVLDSLLLDTHILTSLPPSREQHKDSVKVATSQQSDGARQDLWGSKTVDIRVAPINLPADALHKPGKGHQEPSVGVREAFSTTGKGVSQVGPELGYSQAGGHVPSPSGQVQNFSVDRTTIIAHVPNTSNSQHISSRMPALTPKNEPLRPLGEGKAPGSSTSVGFQGPSSGTHIPSQVVDDDFDAWMDSLPE
eukprot:jgi/Mesen1/738/ME000110S_11003